jgi:carbon monoxide dehydrogenase subunit G
VQVSGEYTFDAPQALVWNALQDPGILGSVLPGGQGFEAVSENEYTGLLSVKVGPVNGTFNGKITLTDVTPPDSYNIKVEGNGAQGYVNGHGGLTLTPQGEKTHMVYQGEAQVGGRIASVGQRLIDASAKSIIRQALEGLNAYLKVEVQKQAMMEAAADAPADSITANDTPGDALFTTPAAPTVTATPPSPPAPVYTPPSQTAVALNVATDVARDLIPAPLRPVLIIGGVALAVLLVLRILRQ